MKKWAMGEMRYEDPQSKLRLKFWRKEFYSLCFRSFSNVVFIVLSLLLLYHKST